MTENDAVTSKVKRPAPEPVIFGGFDAVAEIANRLIPKFHPHLINAKFIFISRSKSVKHGDSKVPGIVKKCSPIDRFIGSYYLNKDNNDESEPDFMMIIALDVWNDYSDIQRLAIVDHLLTRCQGKEDEETGEMKFKVIQPAVQEFPEVVQRNGNWNDSLQDLSDSMSAKS